MENDKLPKATLADYAKRDAYYALFDESLPSKEEDTAFLKFINSVDWSEETPSN